MAAEDFVDYRPENKLTYAPSNTSLPTSTLAFAVNPQGFVFYGIASSSLTLADTNVNPWATRTSTITPPANTLQIVNALNTYYALIGGDGSPSVDQWNGTSWSSDTALTSAIASMNATTANTIQIAGGTTGLAVLSITYANSNYSLIGAIQTQAGVAGPYATTDSADGTDGLWDGEYTGVAGQMTWYHGTASLSYTFVMSGGINTMMGTLTSSGLTPTYYATDFDSDTVYSEYIPQNVLGPVSTGTAITMDDDGAVFEPSAAWEINNTVYRLDTDSVNVENGVSNVAIPSLTGSDGNTVAWMTGAGTHLYEINLASSTYNVVSVPDPVSDTVPGGVFTGNPTTNVVGGYADNYTDNPDYCFLYERGRCGNEGNMYTVTQFQWVYANHTFTTTPVQTTQTTSDPIFDAVSGYFVWDQ